MTTEEFAKNQGLKAQSVLARLCRTGSYYGVVPTKRVNGRLDWQLNEEDKARLKQNAVAQEESEA
jgi:hypothetical protein